MIHICCVKWGTRYGEEYVTKLLDMVQRNLSQIRGRFVCFTDAPISGIECEELPNGVEGWWNKLYLFSALPKGDRVLYFDLDTLIVGQIDDIAAYDGPFCMLRDFYRPDGLQSAVMAWEAGTLDHLWHDWLSEGCPMPITGDQTWIESRAENVNRWQDIFPNRFVSYKQTRAVIPDEASVVCFHGLPRPHEVRDGWVPEVWRVGGISRADLTMHCNTTIEAYMKNVRVNSERDLPWLTSP